VSFCFYINIFRVLYDRVLTKVDETGLLKKVCIRNDVLVSHRPVTDSIWRPWIRERNILWRKLILVK